MSDENNIGMGEKATVTATRLVLLCSKAIEEYRDALREQEYDETGPLTIIPSDFEIARDVVVEFFEERRKTPEPEKNSGNAAAMRDALDGAHKTLRLAAEHAADVMQPRLVEEIVHTGKAIEHAIAAPARNCDRFQTAKDALDAFIREKAIKEEDVDNMNLRDFFDWLFAPEEGETK